MTAPRLTVLPLVAVVALVVGALFPGGSALAAEPLPGGANYYGEFCGDGLRSNGQGAWYLSFDCPSMTLTQVAPALPAENAIANGPTGLPPIAFVRVTMSGSNGAARGVQQGIRICGDVRCGPLVRPPSDDAAPQQYTLTIDSGEVPTFANRVDLVARCVQKPACPIGPGITFSNLVIGFTDGTPPRVQLSEVGPAPELAPVEDRPGPWHNDVIMWDWAAEDGESGVLATTFDGPPLDWPAEPSFTPQDCDASVIVPAGGWCTPGSGSVWRGSSVAGLPQGINTITARSVDLVGNASVDTLPFRVDTIAPAPPTDLAVVGAANGWVKNEHVRLRWTALPGAETVETPTQSGIAFALVDFDPVEPAWNDSWLPTEVPLDPYGHLFVDVPEPAQWSATVRLVDRAGNASEPKTVAVRVDPQEVPAPDIEPVAPITAATPPDGVTVRWSLQQRPVSGICGYAAAVNGVENFDPGKDPRRPDLVGDVTSWRLPPAKVAALDDGPTYVHLRAFSCAGVAGALTHLELTADLTPPAVRAEPAPAWLESPAMVQFRATDDSPAARGSGVARIDITVDGGVPWSSLGSDVSVPMTEGGHVVTAVAVDRAGNRSAPVRVEAGVDNTAPVASVAPVDPDDPLVVRGTAVDAGAGLSSATLEYRAANGAGLWQRLGRRAAPAAPTNEPISIVARFPDEGELDAGRYLLRVVAVDALGHRTEALTRSDGTAAALTAPVRPRPTITANLTTVDGASDVPQVAGQLSSPEGVPLVGAPVELVAALQGGSSEQVGLRVTDAAGTFRLPVAPGGSRVFTAIYRGTATIGPARASVSLDVHAGATLRITPKVLRGRGRGSFRGQVLSPGVALPLAGKLVEIEVRSAGRWRPFGVSTRTASDGSFRIGFRATPRPRAVRIAFRARVPLEPGWPLLDGVSPVAKVVIAP